MAADRRVRLHMDALVVRGESRAEELVEAVARLVPAMRAEAATLDADFAFPVDAIEALRDAGALAAPVRRSEGGLGLGTEPLGASNLARLLRLAGAGSLPVGRVFEGHVNAIRLVGRYGDEAQRREAAADAAAGHLFAVWNTPDAAAPLVLQPDGRLTGAKALASAAGFATRPIVTARSPDGSVRMVLLRLAGTQRADLSRWTAHGMRASATGRIDLDGIDVPPGWMIGGAGDYERQPDFSGGAWRVCAVQLGGLDAIMELFRSHIVGLGRDGDPHQRARFGHALIAQETARLWVARAASIAEQNAAPAEDIVAYVNLARGAVEAACLDVIRLAQRSVGLAAFMRPDPLERICRDLATYLRQPAPDRALTEGAAHFFHAPLPDRP